MPCSQHLKKYTSDSARYNALWYRLNLKAKKQGYKVIPHSNLPNDIAGSVNYHKRTIRLNVPCFVCAIMTLTHELGHIEDRLANGKIKHKIIRERNADTFGFKIVNNVGFKISKKEYIVS